MSLRSDSRSARGIHQYTYDAYLEYESSSNVKHEFGCSLDVDDVYRNVEVAPARPPEP